MQPRQLSLFIGIPTYGGNGGISSLHPDVAEWFVKAVMWAKNEPRIDRFCAEFFADTPVTLTRNRFVTEARKGGYDLLLMVDSDQAPDFHRGDPDFKPFLPSTFDYLYDHYDKGPVVIAAPYC